MWHPRLSCKHRNFASHLNPDPRRSVFPALGQCLAIQVFRIVRKSVGLVAEDFLEFSENPNLDTRLANTRNRAANFRVRKMVQYTESHVENIADCPPVIGSEEAQIGQAAMPKCTREESILMVRDQLRLIIHAQKCKSFPPSMTKAGMKRANKCRLPHCSIMKNVFRHQEHCETGSQCSYPKCYSTRTLIKHCNECKGDDCSICQPERLLTN